MTKNENILTILIGCGAAITLLLVMEVIALNSNETPTKPERVVIEEAYDFVYTTDKVELMCNIKTIN